MNLPSDPLLRRIGASVYLKQRWGIERAPATLAKLACVGGGPKFYRAGRWPMYDAADLDLWRENFSAAWWLPRASRGVGAVAMLYRRRGGPTDECLLQRG